jgi:hypothetical protein
LDGVTGSEVHLVAYVACLLSIYRRFAASEWGYGFIRSQWGAPFSIDVDNALTTLTGGGLLVSRNEVVGTSSLGKELIDFLGTTTEHRWRSEFLEGACASVLAMPIGSIRDALHQEPSLRRANVHKQPRVLLGGDEDAALYEQFGALKDVIGVKVTDLMVPSVVWLTYLGEVRRLEMERASAAGTSGDQEPQPGE